MRAWIAPVLTLALLVAACSADGSAGSAGDAPELPTIDGPGIRTLIAEEPRPLVINVWASWCGPCRSEAPLLASAHARFGDAVRFVGIDTQDARTPAREFISEFGLEFEHWFDQPGAVRAELGGFGVPVTYFVKRDGSVEVHPGIIDERALVLGLEEILAD